MRASSEILDKIKMDLNKKSPFVRNVRHRSFDDTILLEVPWENVGPISNKTLTSNRQLSFLKKSLSKKYSVNVEIVFLQSEAHSDMEVGIFQLLNFQFEKKVKSFYISVKDGKTVDTWIEVEALNHELKNEIQDYLNLVLKPSFCLGEVQWFDDQNLPTIPAILRLIKIMQPVEIVTLTNELRKNHLGLNYNWLKTKLDNLRKEGFLIWSKPDIYSLTSKSLSFVPSGKRRSSSDIKRALALGKRKW